MGPNHLHEEMEAEKASSTAGRFRTAQPQAGVPGVPSGPERMGAGDVLSWQRLAGNRAVSGVLRQGGAAGPTPITVQRSLDSDSDTDEDEDADLGAKLPRSRAAYGLKSWAGGLWELLSTPFRALKESRATRATARGVAKGPKAFKGGYRHGRQHAEQSAGRFQATKAFMSPPRGRDQDEAEVDLLSRAFTAPAFASGWSLGRMRGAASEAPFAAENALHDWRHGRAGAVNYEDRDSDSDDDL